MAGLTAFQEALGAYVLGGAAAPAEAYLSGAPERVRLHRETTEASLEEVLATTYRCVSRSVGPENFRILFQRHLKRKPPTEARLLAWGGGFANTIAGIPEALSDLPWLPDLARLEWAVQESYFAADEEPFTADSVAGMEDGDLARLRLRMRWPTRIVRTSHAVHDLVHSDRSAKSVAREGQTVLVWRAGDVVASAPLEPADAAFTCCLARGRRLEEAVAAAFEADAGFTFPVMLARHFERATFARPRGGGNQTK